MAEIEFGLHNSPTLNEANDVVPDIKRPPDNAIKNATDETVGEWFETVARWFGFGSEQAEADQTVANDTSGWPCCIDQFRTHRLNSVSGTTRSVSKLIYATRPLTGQVALGLMNGVKSWSRARGAKEILFHVTSGVDLARAHKSAKHAGFHFIGGSYVQGFS